MRPQFRWLEHLNTLISRLINVLYEFKRHTKSVSLRKPFKYGHPTRALCLSIRNRASILKLWMEHELRDPDSFEGKRYKLFRIFPNVQHLQYPSSYSQRQHICVTLHTSTLSMFWRKKYQWIKSLRKLIYIRSLLVRSGTIFQITKTLISSVPQARQISKMVRNGFLSQPWSTRSVRVKAIRNSHRWQVQWKLWFFGLRVNDDIRDSNLNHLVDSRCAIKNYTATAKVAAGIRHKLTSNNNNLRPSL